ncbi:MAG: MerR family transcriptional regulator [Sphingomonadales bacterium]|jgi:DNA-binding transcriptional MerR regulator
MIDSLAIDDVVRRTGLTARALRFYEARGLVTPLRTDSGRRLYDAAALERVHRIVALKKAGLSLGDIKRLFDRKPVDLAALLAAQRTRLAEQASEVSAAIALIDTALSRIGRGEPLDAATLCSLIRDGDKVMTDEAKAWKDVVDRYYSAEEQAEWKARMPAWQESDQAAYSAKWHDLGSRIAAAMPLDPASDQALAFVREWFTLLEPFSRNATEAMWTRSAGMYADMDRWQDKVDPGFDKTVWEFIATAARTARAAGKDIGPVPAFMRGAAG